MSQGPSTYHQRVAAEKRAAILAASGRLFADCGYDRTSLSQIAAAAGVSTATLFKQFPNKTALFEAVVVDFWTSHTIDAVSPPEAPEEGLRVLGTRYARLLSRDGMTGLFRIVIAEAPRFPELARIQFDLGKAPFFDEVRAYFQSAGAAGRLDVEDAGLAATQFLGMISNYILWPRLLLPDWPLSESGMAYVVDGAVATILARYLPGDSPRPTAARAAASGGNMNSHRGP